MLIIANSLLDGFWISNTVGKTIVILQLLSSLIMFSVIFGKGCEIRLLNKAANFFMTMFTNSASVLDPYVQRRTASAFGLEKIYRDTCDRLLKLLSPEARNALAGIADPLSPSAAALTAREIALVRSTCEQTAEEEIKTAEKWMNGIACVVSLSPMLGLLGTVWGVLDAFADMGSAGSANLATIAPAISSALVTTVIGLIVAIPGVVAFNILNSKIRDFVVKAEGLADELPGRIACEYQGRNA